jgi:nickel/cobalt transporter (NicO) family protein
MNNEMIILVFTAVSAAFIHTALGPDHYLPFIALSRAWKWSRTKTAVITILCGVGHVASSVILAIIGVAIGAQVFKIQAIESFRGDIAAWFLLGFGFIYMVWGVFHAVKNTPHEHVHAHTDGAAHVHVHNHHNEHAHPHNAGFNAAPWLLFIIFIFGPCEPMIPIVMYPAAKGNITEAIVVSLAFSLVTIATMTAIVLISTFGLAKIDMKKYERFSHAAAGLVVFAAGIGVKVLGL